MAEAPGLRVGAGPPGPSVDDRGGLRQCGPGQWQWGPVGGCWWQRPPAACGRRAAGSDAPM
eukprot:6083113-Prorocentrum_lima.AAC.1